MADCLMAQFTRKECGIAGILLELVDLIPRFNRRNHKPRFPTWSTKSKRYLNRPPCFAGARFYISRSNSFSFRPNLVASPSSVTHIDHPPTAENLSKGRKDGIFIDLNKYPEEVLISEDLDPSPSEKPFSPHDGCKDGIFIDTNRNSKEGVPIDGDKLKVEIIMEVQCCKPTLEKKRKREESLISWTKEKKRRVGNFPEQRL